MSYKFNVCSEKTDYFLCSFYDVMIIMKIPCAQCSERYELSTSVEYLIKMGMIPFERPFYCEECRR
jgi:hypothetical protein